MKKALEGGCLCGEIRYSAERDVIDAGYCHCRVCQRASGAPVVAWFTVPVDSFTYTSGKPSAFRSSAQSQREFCGNCGTQLVFRRGEHAVTVDISISSLDDPSLVEPEYHIWTESRIPWFDTRDTLPRHADSGPDADVMDAL